MAKKDYDYQFKIFLIGDSAVGKTSILRKFSDESYDASHIATVGKYIEKVFLQPD